MGRQPLLPGILYTAKELKEMGITPCLDCPPSAEASCSSQCMWPYWNKGERENTLWYYDGTLRNDGTPKYTGHTLRPVLSPKDEEKARRLRNEYWGVPVDRGSTRIFIGR